MNTLWLLTKKNLKLLIRSKGSALIVIFAPLLIILTLGLSFNNSDKYGINIGVYSPTFNEDVNSFISTLQEQEFKIIKYNGVNGSSKEDCIEDVKWSFVHTCIFLPDSFKIESNTPKEITFYIDPSKINLVWMVQQTLESKFNLKAQQISQDLAQDLLTRTADATTKIGTEKDALTGIKQKEESAASSVDSAKSGLASVDLAPPTTEYNANVLADFRDTLKSKLDNSTSSLNSAKSVVSASNISSSDQSSINSFITSAQSTISAAKTLVTATSGNASLGAVSDLIGVLQTDVTAAKNKLSSASTQVSSTTTNLDAVKTTLGESITALESVQTSLDAVHANLQAQKVTDAKVFSSPLITKIEKVSPENTYLNYMFPALIILVVMFSSLLLGTTLVMMEKNSPAFTRNFFLPVSKVTFVLSTYLTNLILILLQLVIILGISLVFLPEILATLPALALVMFLAASVFTFLGMAIGYIFISEETAVLGSISTGSLLLFVSGVILPLESVSPTLRDITYFNPFVIAENLAREILLFSSPLLNLWTDFLTLFIYAVVLFLLILVIESWLHRRLRTKLLHHSQKPHQEGQH